MPTILLIDHDDELRGVLAIFLRRNGYEVITPRHCQAVINAAITGRFDLAVTEIIMPHIDGIEVFQAVKRRYPEMPVIGISGGAHLTSADMALSWIQALGAAAVLCKPFQPYELLIEIDKAIHHPSNSGDRPRMHRAS